MQMEVTGFWWLPDAPKVQIPGTLHFGRARASELRLLGSFEEEIAMLKRLGTAGETYKHEVINGIAANGKKYTLYQATNAGGNWTNGLMLCVFAPQIVIEGECFGSATDIVFESLTFRVSHAEEWYAVTGKNYARPIVEGNKHSVSFAYQRPETLKLAVTGGTVSIGHDWRADYGLYFRPFVLHENVAISIQPTTPAHLDYYLDTWLPVLNRFLALLIGSPVSFGKITANSLNENSTQSVTLTWQRRRIGNSKDILIPGRVLVPFADIRENCEHLLGCWVSLHQQLRPVMDLFFGKVLLAGTFSFNNFVNAVQVLESYHRRIRGGVDITVEDHQARINSILQGAPQDHRAWLEKKLAHSNEISLRKRLVELLTENALLFDITRRQIKGYARRIADIRNHYSHHAGGDENYASWREMYKFHQLIRWTLTSCFLKQIGLSEEKVHASITVFEEFIYFKSVELHGRNLQCIKVETIGASKVPCSTETSSDASDTDTLLMT
jgi:hypothetical protein